MLTKASLLAAAIALASGPARAADPRIQSIFYQPRVVVTVAGRPNVQSTILFAPDERIENVAVGDSAAWQVTPNKRANLLFLKPQSPRGRTNMTVITDQRTYLFDLVARPGGAAPLYALQFTYPAPPPPPPALPKPAEATGAPVTPVALNFDWASHGAKSLLPQRVFDDGRSVYLAWAPEVMVPAMLSVAPDGTEGPVNYTVKGSLVVVDGVPGRLVLRAGKEFAMLDHGTGAARVALSQPTQTAER